MPKLEANSVILNFDELQHDPKTRPLFIVTGICGACLLFIVYCVSISRSLLLTSCAWLTLFSIFSMGAAIVGIATKNRHSDAKYTYGLARAPVLAVFSSTVLAQLSALFIVKECVEHLLEGDEHGHSHWFFLPATFTASFAQLLAAYAVKNEPLNQVLTAASSSWLQEHAADISHALCQLMPGLSRFLLPRLNSLGLLAFCSTVTCLVSHYLLTQRHLWWADPIGALCLSIAVIGSMLPLSIFSGRILLQTSASHIVIQLDRCLHEAETLDGVLEVNDAHFWQLDFNKMAGTVNARVRREADEQVVLAHITDKLSSLVSELTVQITKSADLDSLVSSKLDSGGHDWDGHHGHSHDNGDHGHSHGGGGHHGHSHDNGAHSHHH